MTSKLGLAILLFFVGIDGSSSLKAQGTQGAQGTPVQVLVKRASNLDQQGLNDLAAESWQKVLLLDPNQTEALTALSNFYRSKGDAASSKRYLDRLRAVSPRDAQVASDKQVQTKADNKALLDKAAHLADAHQFSEALTAYREAFGGSKPPDTWALPYYDTEAAIPSELPDALAGLRGLVAKYPHVAKYQLALGRVLTYSPATRLSGVQMLEKVQGTPQEMDQARAAWRQALEWDPGSAVAKETASAYLARYPDKELEDSLRSDEAHRVPKVAPMPIDPAEGLAYAALEKGNTEEATRLFESLLPVPTERGRAELGLGYVSMKAQNFAAAATRFQSAIADGADNAAATKALSEAKFWGTMAQGNEALKQHQFEGAIARFTQAHQMRPTTPEPLEMLGAVNMQSNRPENAVTFYEQATRVAPDRVEGWTGLSTALMQAGKPEKVISNRDLPSTQMRARLDGNPDYLAVIASAEIALGHRKNADSILDRLKQIAAIDGGQRKSADMHAAEILMAEGNSRDAVQLCLNVIKADQNNLEAWEMLVRAEHAQGKTRFAIDLARRMPAEVYQAALRDPEFLVSLAGIYEDDQQLEQAHALLDRAVSQAGQSSTSVTMQMAALALAEQRPETAYVLYQQVISADPTSVPAWTGMISSLHQAKHDREAMQAVNQMPADVSWHLQDNVGYLQTLASIYGAVGQSRQALDTLRRLVIRCQQQREAVPADVSIQLGWLYLNGGFETDLASDLAQLGVATNLTSEQQTQVVNLWTNWSMRRADRELQNGHPDRALAILTTAAQTYPNDATLRRTLAADYVRTGSPDLALRYFSQLNWDSAELADYTGAISAANAARRNPQAELWLRMGLQRWPQNHELLALGAQVAENTGDHKLAERYLEAEVQSSMATAPLTAPPGSGLQQNAGVAPDPSAQLANLLTPSGPSASSVPALPPTASASLLAPQLRPRDAGDDEVLAALSGLHAPAAPARSNDYATPTGNFQESPAPVRDRQSRTPAVPASPTPQSRVEQPPTGDSSSAAVITPAVFVTHPVSTRGRAPTAPPSVDLQTSEPANLPPLALEPVESAAPLQAEMLLPPPTSPRNQTVLTQAPALTPAAYPIAPVDVLPPMSSFAPTSSLPPMTAAPAFAALPPVTASSSSFNPFMPVTASPIVLTPAQRDAQALETLRARYSPWVGEDTTVTTRSGNAGFDKLTIVSASTEVSSIVGNAARLSIITTPYLIDAGTPDGASTYNFGSTGTTLATGTDQFASGIGGQLQLTSTNVDASIGYTPAQFLISNVTGRFAIHPAHKPIGFQVYRDAIQETMLSFAGETDPGTGKQWGGVTATGGDLTVFAGGADSGFYGSAGAALLTGLNVTDNTRIRGNAGAYWALYTSSYGQLKVGANLSMEHFANDQRYFTLGQGGYFSPNAYLLATAPVTWQGHPTHNFAYTLSGNFGGQIIQQYAPVAGSQIASAAAANSIATSLAGSAYDLHVRGAYRVNSHWYIGAFGSSNNSHDYQSSTGGFFIKYMIRPQTEVEGGPTGLFDEAAPRPLAVP